MSNKIRSSIRRTFGNRAATVAAGAIGLVLGASGLVAAQGGADDLPSSSADNSVETTVDDTMVEQTAVESTVDTNGSEPMVIDLTIPSADSSSSSVPATGITATSPPAGGDDSTSTSLPDDSTSVTLPDNDDDDPATSSTLPDNDDATSTTLPDDDDEDDNDDATSTTLPDDDDEDDNATSTSVPGASAPPAPFTETYVSSGGSITVTWSGTALSIGSISPATGFGAEIEDHSWDKVRVDFEMDDRDSRIEVRVDDGQVRVRID